MFPFRLPTRVALSLALALSLCWSDVSLALPVETAGDPGLARSLQEEEPTSKEKDESEEKQEPAPKKERDKLRQVKVKVIDRDGGAVEGAQVFFKKAKENPLVTNSGGLFRFEGSPGDYRITITARKSSKVFKLTIGEEGVNPGVLEMDF